MEIMLQTLYPGASLKPAFILTIEPAHFGVMTSGGSTWLTTQVRVRRANHWDDLPPQCYPVLWDLNATLTGADSHAPAGQSLLAPEGLPNSFAYREADHYLMLAFPFPSEFAQALEDERTLTQAQQDVRLKLRIWGSALIAAEKAPIQGFVAFRSEGIDPEIRIPRSDWLDRLLPATGYPYRRQVVLPNLMAGQQPEELQQAVAHLAQAWDLFRSEHYRESVQRCRQARDALLGANKTTWAQTMLGPMIGTEKAAMLDEGINALNRLGNTASHGANTVEIDRETAEYVVGSLTLVLNYIGRKMQ